MTRVGYAQGEMTLGDLIYDETFQGTLMKVMLVDPDNYTFHGQVQNGTTIRLASTYDSLPSRGDIVIATSNEWRLAPRDLWLASNSVAVVRSISDDGSVLLEEGIGLKLAKNLQNISLKRNNTVEFNDIDGVVKVISDEPIRIRDRDHGQTDILEEFLLKPTEDGSTFDDFGGYEDVVERARELIETQINCQEFLDEIGARPVKGVLFTGPPGTGKTHLARIIADVSQADFFLVNGPSVVSKWVGDSEDTLRRIFEAATNCESGRAIIFFDEIDSIAERRNGDSHEASRRLVSQMLTLMDGFETKGKSVVVIAATNRIDALDPALTRPGRFDWEIEFGMPNVVDRYEILRVGARRIKTLGELPLEDIAILTEGWSAAQLTAIWAEAALIAGSQRRGVIAGEDLALALERVSSRPQRVIVQAVAQ
jgi:transitional endoplasmic reticulum ATPase